MSSEMTTPVDADFVFTTGATGRVLQSQAIARLAPHLITTRHFEFRGDSAGRDYGRVTEWFGLGSGALITVKQVHGRAVLVVRPGDDPGADRQADAIVCTDPARAIAVRVADCVPVLIADMKQRAVAVVHAGWRGTCAGVTAAAVETMAELGIPAADLVAAIGPSIGACCYQVDDRVRTAFLGMTPDAAAWFDEDGPGHWRLDLWAANADTLESAGVAVIHQARMCTRDLAADFFSYRREGPGTGRIVAAIRLRGVPGSE